jgi:DNA-directed RNA polymerase specialized sigma24 family protein
MVDAEILCNIQNVKAREELFADLYERAFPLVATFVSNRKGTFQDARDIFQDALVIFYEKLVVGALKISVSDEAYVLGIAKHLWIREFNHERNKVPLDEFECDLTIPEDYFPSASQNKLLYFIGQAGKKCMDLLQAFYYDKFSMQEIASKFGYGSTHSATVQKFKCIEKIRDRIKEKSIVYEDFNE